MAHKQISNRCPSCDLPMQTAAMECVTCGVKIEAAFTQSVLSKLGSEDQQFLEEYLLAGFSIKTMEEKGLLGYAAIRSRLDRLIENFKELQKKDVQKKKVLEKLKAGKITVAEAKVKLMKLSGE